MLTINNNMYPKGGHVFVDSDGTKHVGDSWPGVIARVRAYRQRAGLAPGDVAAEVISQACQNNPGLCREETAAYREQLNQSTLKTRVLQWLTDLRGRAQSEPIVFVSDEERKARAQVCSTCPGNQALPGGCQSCLKALTELRKVVIGNRLADGRLSACGFLGEDLPSAVHLDQVRVSRGDLPANCWRKATH
jgi:hypothetical protein